jgi:serine phosphatase RsbU (regulator of sigma subunit)
MDNARLYTETRHIAQTLQNSLLPPQMPDIPGVEVAARYLPAGEGTDVGGDFYDLFETYDGAWGVVIGDVCGKGPEAAAVTGLARYTIRAAAMKEASPSSILGTLNEAIRTQRDDLRFATVAYARMSRDNGSLHVATACGGHPLPILLRKDGSVEHLGQPGTLLGVFGDADLVDRSAVLLPGDAVIMYTDGITQDRGPLGPLTDESLAALVGTFAGLDAEAMADRILEAAMGEDPEGPRDDMAVLALKVAS